jgi:hypothetical protein
MTKVRFKLDIDKTEALRYYQGHARFVIVTAENGQRLQFLAKHIRAFIEPDGLHGDFSITFDSNNKLIEIKRI